MKTFLNVNTEDLLETARRLNIIGSLFVDWNKPASKREALKNIRQIKKSIEIDLIDLQTNKVTKVGFYNDIVYQVFKLVINEQYLRESSESDYEERELFIADSRDDYYVKNSEDALTEAIRAEHELFEAINEYVFCIETTGAYLKSPFIDSSKSLKLDVSNTTSSRDVYVLSSSKFATNFNLFMMRHFKKLFSFLNNLGLINSKTKTENSSYASLTGDIRSGEGNSDIGEIRKYNIMNNLFRFDSGLYYGDLQAENSLPAAILNRAYNVILLSIASETQDEKFNTYEDW